MRAIFFRELLRCRKLLLRKASLWTASGVGNGYKIKMVEVAEAPLGVDTQDDLDRVCKMIIELGYRRQ